MLRASDEDDHAEGGGGAGVELRTLGASTASAMPKPPARRRRGSPWRVRMGVRPLVGVSWLPWEARELTFGQIFVAALAIGALVSLIAKDSLPWLSQSYCEANSRKPFCDRLSYRLAKAGRHLGTALHMLTAINFLLVCRKPLYALFGLSIERLAKWHRWSGHLVVIGSVLHGLGYYNVWISMDVWNEKFYKSKNLAGTLALVPLLVLWALSLEPVRRGCFRLFYRAHIFCVPLFVAGLCFHHEADQFLLFACVPFVLLFGDKLWRARHARRLPWRIAGVRAIGNDTLCIDMEPLPRDGILVLGLSRFPATSWVSINVPALSRWQMHPFSVCKSKALQRRHATNPDADPPAALTVYSRAPANAGNWTRAALSLGEALVSQRCFVDGPYGALELPLSLGDYDAYIFAAGGIGITPLLPVFEELIEADTLSSVPGLFIFTTSDASLAEEFQPVLNDISAAGEYAQTRVHLTDASAVQPLQPVTMERVVKAAQDGAQSLVDQSQDLEVSKGRPNFSESAADLMASLAPGSLVAALCCGPVSMDRAFMQAISAVSRSQGVTVHFHREGFGL
ncbi:Ferric reduction oxidase 2 [Hondaea fermentalgiana]|uniref:Ferric reduction oxidase 2 n=1 Tax=Hondaea fermentalgiana TaxID=2315210 RepID=A0A2R5GIN0_9STRA|nr:Ferric reduction oxidase 2 [Hondaea fermentalgiana]|eukprot:GBG30750.1 Ferric reduction oxidase 2 [Hondaea fermentalgiana]